jgi:hypothetical protein
MLFRSGFLAACVVVSVCNAAAPVDAVVPGDQTRAPFLTYNNRPMGSLLAPLVLRTYLPDPGLEDSVFQHHFKADKTAEYSPEKGEDVGGEVVPLPGIAAAIAVNMGPALSYVFDTTEGRLLLAWQGGFVDMYPYWGEKGLGTRRYDYVPKLVGTLFYKASGKHPLQINNLSVSDLGAPHFVGYDLVNGQPEFLVRYGKYTVRTRIQAGAETLAYGLQFTVEPAAKLSYRTEDERLNLQQQPTSDGGLSVKVTGTSLGMYEGYSREVTVKVASVEAGAQFYRNYSCAVCHSTDGSVSHGPTYRGLFGRRDRPLVDGTTVKVVDEAYLLESIKDPNAKLAQGFQPNFMPPYNHLQQVEYDSLILFIKSLSQPE